MLREGKTANYLKYAIGEIILVVVGILIALSINSWNGNRIEKSNEFKTLTELKKGLETDLKIMQNELLIIQNDVEKISQLEKRLGDKSYTYDSSLDSLFGPVYGIRTIRLNKAFYEDLKGSGLRLIKDDAIRLRIVNLFEDNYSFIFEMFDIELNLNEVTRPYYLTNFHDILFNISAIPNDFEKTWNDPYYKNIVNYRKICLQSNQIDAYKRTIPDIRLLIDAIQVYLSQNQQSNPIRNG